MGEWQDVKADWLSWVSRDPEGGLVLLRTMHGRNTSYWVMDVIREAVNAMARGKGKSNAPEQQERGNQWTTFVKVDMRGVEWGDVVKSMPFGKDLMERLGVLLFEGYRVSFTYDSRTDTVNCSFTGRGEGAMNSGKTLSSFAQSWPEALQLNFYKHATMLEGDWTNGREDADRPKFG